MQQGKRGDKDGGDIDSGGIEGGHWTLLRYDLSTTPESTVSDQPYSALLAWPRLGTLVVLLALGCSPYGDEAPQIANASSRGCLGVEGRTIRWIVPFTPGGGYDVYSRLLEPLYEEAIGAEILIQNRVGAGGRVGARAVRDAEPDGRTLGLLNAYSLLVGELSGDLSGLNPVEDFTVLGRISPSSPVWVTGSGSRYGTVDDVLAQEDDQPILE